MSLRNLVTVIRYPAYCALTAVSLLACSSEVSVTRTDATGLPDELSIKLKESQSEPYTVEVLDALKHLDELSGGSDVKQLKGLVEFFIDDQIDASVRRNIINFISTISNASGLEFVEVNIPDVSEAGLAFVSSSYWKSATPAEYREMLGPMSDSHRRWFDYGCLLISPDALASIKKYSSDVERLNVRIGMIAIDEDLARVLETERFEHGVGKYRNSIKCIGSGILLALGFGGVPETHPSIVSDPIWAPKNANYSRYDYAAIELLYEYNVSVSKRVTRR